MEFQQLGTITQKYSVPSVLGDGIHHNKSPKTDGTLFGLLSLTVGILIFSSVELLDVLRVPEFSHPIGLPIPLFLLSLPRGRKVM
jgi:hypothetical protein